MISRSLTARSILFAIILLTPNSQGFGQEGEEKLLATKLPPLQVAEISEPSQRLEDNLRAEIRDLEDKIASENTRLDKVQKELERLERIGKVGTKQLFDDFVKKKIPYRDYIIGATHGELEKNRELQEKSKATIESEIRRLTEKKKARVEELQDYQNIRRQASPAPPLDKQETKERKQILSERVTERRNELSVEQDYLQRAEMWQRDYPGHESAESTSFARQRVSEVKNQLRQAEKELETLQSQPSKTPPKEVPSQVLNTPQVTSPSEPKRPFLTESERQAWRAKGFSRIEIDTLVNGGVVVDETGHSIMGWPPSSLKKKLSFTERLRRSFSSSK